MYIQRLYYSTNGPIKWLMRLEFERYRTLWLLADIYFQKVSSYVLLHLNIVITNDSESVLWKCQVP